VEAKKCRANIRRITTAVGKKGFFYDEISKKKIDFLNAFLQNDKVHFIFFHKTGKEFRINVPLFSFKEKYIIHKKRKSIFSIFRLRPG
jgi:hypothetical protein